MEQTQLLKGILEGCVLEIISQREIYGYELIQILNEKGIDQIRNVYPGAHDWNVWRMCIHDFAQLIFK